MKIIIKGAGDLATGIATVLHQAGFSVVMTDLVAPTVIRRTVSFAQAMYDGQVTVEGITGTKASPEEVGAILSRGEIPVLADPQAEIVRQWKPDGVVDAILAKQNLGTGIGDAPMVIGLGPGFTAGKDVHMVIETMRGHDLGRLILEGCAQPNTGSPGEIGGRSDDRVLRAPRDGVFRGQSQIGDEVRLDQIVGFVNDQPVRAPFDGVLRGLLYDGLSVPRGFKVGDVDPRPVREYCFTVSDKARSLGGAVLCALMVLQQNRSDRNGL